MPRLMRTAMRAARFREAMKAPCRAARLKARARSRARRQPVGSLRRCAAHADLDVLLLAGRRIADQTALLERAPLRSAARGGRRRPFNSGIPATGAQPADGRPPFFDYAPAPSEVIERAAAIERVCAAHAVPLKAAARSSRAHPAVACVLAGARTLPSSRELPAMLAHPIPPVLARPTLRTWTRAPLPDQVRS
jgi:hypothetical protein